MFQLVWSCRHAVISHAVSAKKGAQANSFPFLAYVSHRWYSWTWRCTGNFSSKESFSTTSRLCGYKSKAWQQQKNASMSLKWYKELLNQAFPRVDTTGSDCTQLSMIPVQLVLHKVSLAENDEFSHTYSRFLDWNQWFLFLRGARGSSKNFDQVPIRWQSSLFSHALQNRKTKILSRYSLIHSEFFEPYFAWNETPHFWKWKTSWFLGKNERQYKFDCVVPIDVLFFVLLGLEPRIFEVLSSVEIVTDGKEIWQPSVCTEIRQAFLDSSVEGGNLATFLRYYYHSSRLSAISRP